MAKTKKWSRAEKLTLWAVLIGASAALANWVVVPEFRQAAHLGKPSQAETRPATPAISSQATNKLVALTATSIEEARQSDHVTLIPESDSGETLSEIPTGLFGYVEPGYLSHSYGQDIVLDSHANSRYMEVHKLADGNAKFVVYVGPETFDRLRKGVSKGENLTIYSSSWSEAHNLVVIPADGIKCNRHRQLEVDDEKVIFIAALDCAAS